MVSTRLPTSKSSSPFFYPLVTVPNAPITISIIVTCMFRSFFQFPKKVDILIFLFTFFQFYSVVNRDSNVDNFACSLLLLIIIRSGLLAEIRWSVCMSKSHWDLCVLCSNTGAGFCIYHLFAWSNLLLLLLFTLLEFFSSALAISLSLEFEGKQVSTSLQDSSQYCGRSQHCCSFEGPYSFSDFQDL